jgi:hypothetical protein
MPDSTTIAETITAGTDPDTGVSDSIESSTQNSGMDWLEGCPDAKDDQGTLGAITETKEPLIPRLFPVYAFI